MQHQRQQLPPLARYLSPRVGYKWLALVAVTLVVFTSAVDSTVVFIALPTLAETFDADTSTVVWVGISHLVVSVGLLLTMGWIGDATGRSRLFKVGVVVFALGTVLAALAQNIHQLIAIRALVGVAYALMFSNSNAILTTAFPHRQRGLALGYMGVGLGLGLAVGPVAGGLLIDALDWRAIFWSLIPLQAITVLLPFLLLSRDRGAGILRVDLGGAIALFLTLSSLLLAVNQAGRVGVTHPVTLSAVAVALVGAVILVGIEKRAFQPLLHLGLFRRRPYSVGLASLLLMYLASNSVVAVSPFLMINGLGYSVTKAGLLTVLFYGTRPLASPLAGWLSDRRGSGLLLAGGIAVLMSGLIVLSRVEISSAADVLLPVGFTLAGLGAALFEPVAASSIMGSVPRERLGTASASIATFRHIGLSGGAALGAAIFAAGAARSAGVSASQVIPEKLPPAALASGAEASMVVAAGICLVAMVAILARRRTRQRPHPG